MLGNIDFIAVMDSGFGKDFKSIDESSLDTDHGSRITDYGVQILLPSPSRLITIYLSASRTMNVDRIYIHDVSIFLSALGCKKITHFCNIVYMVIFWEGIL